MKLDIYFGEGYPQNATSAHGRPLYCIQLKYDAKNSGKGTRVVG